MAYDNGSNDGRGVEKEVICTRGVPYLVVLLLVLITYVAGMVSGVFLIWWTGSSRSESAPKEVLNLPDNFPRTYLCVEDNGKYDAVIIERSKQMPAVPIKREGKEYWDAFLCLNSACPGRTATGARPFLFAGLRSKPSGNYGQDRPGVLAGCPACKGALAKAPAAEQAKYDPQNIERYLTDEAKQIIARLRAQQKTAAAQPAQPATPEPEKK